MVPSQVFGSAVASPRRFRRRPSVLPSRVPVGSAAGPFSYTKRAVFVYESLVFGLPYTVEAVFVYESLFFGPSYTKSAIFVYGDREASPLNSQKRGSPGHFAPDSSLLRTFGP